MTEFLEPIGFWSYTSSDDRSSDGKLTLLRTLLMRELQLAIGQRPRVRIFQDTATIPHGTEWSAEIQKALSESSFIIPILTPGFLQSQWCCTEVCRFREREIELGRSDLIFPIHYIDTSDANPGRPGDCHDPQVLQLLLARQHTDFRDLRLSDPRGQDVMAAIAGLALSIRAALRRDASGTAGFVEIASGGVESRAVTGTGSAGSSAPVPRAANIVLPVVESVTEADRKSRGWLRPRRRGLVAAVALGGLLIVAILVFGKPSYLQTASAPDQPAAGLHDSQPSVPDQPAALTSHVAPTVFGLSGPPGDLRPIAGTESGLIQVLFRDEFSATLDPKAWDYQHWSKIDNPSYYGRTQIRQRLPEVFNGHAYLTLDTYDPTNPGDGFLGSEMYTVRMYLPGTNGVAFEARARLDQAASGTVGGMFAYNFRADTGRHDELDFELISKRDASGHPQVSTNLYTDEPFDAGRPDYMASVDPAEFHVYRIEWFLNRVKWLVDGKLVRETSTDIPNRPMALHFNFWAPAEDWPQASDLAIQPTTSASHRTAYQFLVDYVKIEAVPDDGR